MLSADVRPFESRTPLLLWKSDTKRNNKDNDKNNSSADINTNLFMSLLEASFVACCFFTTVLTHFNQTTDYMLSHKLLLQHRLTPQHRIHHPHPHPHHRRQSSPPSSFRSPYCSQVVFCCKYIFTMYILMHLLLLSKLYNRIYLFTCVHACRTLCMPMCIFRCVPRCVLYCVINPRCFGYIQLEILHIIMYNDIIHCDMLRCAVDCYGCTLAAASLVCH